MGLRVTPRLYNTLTSLEEVTGSNIPDETIKYSSVQPSSSQTIAQLRKVLTTFYVKCRRSAYFHVLKSTYFLSIPYPDKHDDRSYAKSNLNEKPHLYLFSVKSMSGCK